MGFLGLAFTRNKEVATNPEPRPKMLPLPRLLDSSSHKNDEQAALEKAGVEFITENGGGAGVRMKRGETVTIPKKQAFLVSELA
jgi:hypothetical protein